MCLGHSATLIIHGLLLTCHGTHLQYAVKKVPFPILDASLKATLANMDHENS